MKQHLRLGKLFHDIFTTALVGRHGGLHFLPREIGGSDLTRSDPAVEWQCQVQRASQVALVVKNLPASAGNIRDMGSIPGSGICPGGGHGHPLQYSCLENPIQSRGSHRVGHN